MKKLILILLLIQHFYASAQTDGFGDPTFDVGTGFISNPTGLGNNLDGIVYDLAVQSDSKIIVGGKFNYVNNVARNALVRLSSDGSLDVSFTPPATSNDAIISCLAVQPDGKILVYGNYATSGGILNASLFRLNSNGSIDNSFSTTAGGRFVLQADGKILVNGKTRLNNDGSIDNSFSSSNEASGIFSLQPDGKIVLATNEAFPGLGARSITRLNNDGSLDASYPAVLNQFSGGNGGPLVAAIVIQPDGKIIVGGSFTSYNGVFRNNYVRLNSNGSIDLTFTSPFTANSQTGVIRFLTLQPDGKILVANRGSFYRLLPSGAFDRSFNTFFTAPNESPLCLAQQSDGRLLIGGDFAPKRLVHLFNTSTLSTKSEKYFNGILSIYPNPADGIFMINSSEKIDSILVYDTKGKLIKSYEHNMSMKVLVDLNDCSSGMYLFKISIGKKHNTLKVLKN